MLSGRAQTFGVALILALIAGSVGTAAIVLASESTETIRYHLTTSRGIGNLLFISFVAPLPISISMISIGAFLVDWTVRHESAPRSMQSWLARGGIYGTALGATGTTAWIGSMGIVSREELDPSLLAFMGTVGGLCGFIAGFAMGAYACRLARRCS